MASFFSAALGAEFFTCELRLFSRRTVRSFLMERVFQGALRLMPTRLVWAGCAAALVFNAAAASASAAATSATDTGKQNAKPVASPAAVSDQKVDVNPRLAVIERIVKSAQEAMAASEDARAIALTAKYAREAELKAGEVREEKEKSDRHMQALQRAKQLSKKADEDFVDFQIVTFCLAFPAKSMCLRGDPIREFAEKHPENLVGWLTMAAREYTNGLLSFAGTYLERAAKATVNDWYYRVAAETALRYARAVKEPDRRAGDDEAAAFGLLGGLTVPPYRQFAQMCNPNPEGKLPEGRYPLCRKVAQTLLDRGEGLVEVGIANGVLMRLAKGENLAEQEKAAANQLVARDEITKFIWQSRVNYPPRTDQDGEFIAAFFRDLLKEGERKATELALSRFGKKAADFLPK
jgi:hypothetical protein